jgi:hypothetical protein
LFITTTGKRMAQPEAWRMVRRLARRAAAAREGSTGRTATARRVVTDTDAGSAEALAYVLGSVVCSASPEEALAALGLLTRAEDGDLPDRYAAPGALTAYAATDDDHALRAALALHLALAERYASAKHERPGAGAVVVGYLDLLVEYGHCEHPGDAALRARYHRPAPAGLEVIDEADGEENVAE